MQIIVSMKKIWGKELFYPISEDAKFISELTGRPTILKRQLKMMSEVNWNITIQRETVALQDII